MRFWSCSFGLAILTLLGFAARVLANTEQIRFKVAGREAHGYGDDDVHTGIHGTLSLEKHSLIQTINPRHYNDSVTKWFKIEVPESDSQMYEVRVCWPASQPAAFALEYKRGLVGITYSADYYSHIKTLMVQPLPVSYELILNEVVLDALPTDIVATVALVAISLVVVYRLASLPSKLV